MRLIPVVSRIFCDPAPADFDLYPVGWAGVALHRNVFFRAFCESNMPTRALARPGSNVLTLFRMPVPENFKKILAGSEKAPPADPLKHAGGAVLSFKQEERKMANQAAQEDAFATIFSIIGGIVGFGYGAQFSDGEWATPFIVGLVGLILGRFIGAVVFRLILVAMVIIGFLIRDQIVSSLAEAFLG